MTTAAELFALQETDMALDRARGRLAEIEEALGETDEVVEVRQELAAKKAVVADLRAEQKELELSVDEVRRKSGEIEAKLYGGTVSNPKELADLDADLKSLRNQTRTREDVLLSNLVAMEEADAERKAAEARFAEIESEWLAGQQRLSAEKAEIEPEVQRLEALREQQLPDIERSELGLYQVLRERRAGQALARIERGMCQGCRITLPVSLLQKARTGLGLVQCVSCERILLVS